MKKSNFTHLHVHSEYSLLDGACKIKDLVDAAIKNGMPAIALTDHGNMFGTIEFYRTAHAKGIKPIIGFEAYTTAKSRFEKSSKGGKEKLSHLTLLAENNKGYQNLLKLATSAYLEGFYYKPRLDKEILREYSEGLICLSGCMQSEINSFLLKEQKDKAVNTINEYRDIFGKDNFFLELQDNGVKGQKELVLQAIELGKEMNIPLAATNDVHYMNSEDAAVQDVLLCINTQKKVADTDRMKFSSSEFYFKSAEEMASTFKNAPDSISNTMIIADRCDVKLEFGRVHLPKFKPEKSNAIYKEGMTNSEFLRGLCEHSILKIYGNLEGVVKERLDYELRVIGETGFVDYFLIVWDFINFAIENRIQASGRGSGAGSIVAYSLGITNIDPIGNDLLFERFLNAERVNMPDLDIDFCAEGRDKVIEYVRNKYGGDTNVSQIVTFGRMKAKAVIRDVGRVLDVPLAEISNIAKLIPLTLDITLKDAMEQEPELAALYSNRPDIKRLFDISMKLEGQCRHMSTHAAGIVISDKPLTDYLPLAKNGDITVTQYNDVAVVDYIGLLKADFLGLRKITVMIKAIALIKETTGIELNIADIPMDDKKTFDLLSRGDVKGVFQVETSRGIKELLIKLKPQSFDDVRPLIALYRPGPLQSGMVDTFVNCRHGKEKVTYLDPKLEPILKETYGVILYQEQVMRIANVLGGFSLNEADNLRKAMGKKKPEVMAKYKNQFIEGSVKNDVPQKVAKTIFELMEHFAGYGFNKSHSAAYAVITCQTAYLKANYPTQYMVAQLNCEMQNSDKVVGYMGECRRMGIEVLPPCINESMADFSMISDKQVRFGFGAIKNVGEKAIDSIIKGRKSGKFKTFFDFCNKVDLRVTNKQVIESLIKSGSMSTLPGHIAQLLQGLDSALQMANLHNNDRMNKQMTFFDNEDSDIEGFLPEITTLPDVPEWDETEMLNAEKDTLGFYVSTHPLDKYDCLFNLYTTMTTSSLAEVAEDEKVLIGGIVTEIKRSTTKKGDPMAYFTLEDFEGMISGVIFKRQLDKFDDFLKVNEVVFIKGEVGFRNSIPSLRANEIIPVSLAHKKLSGNVTLTLDEAHIDEETLIKLSKTLNSFKGTCPVFIEMITPEKVKVKINVNDRFYITMDSKFKSAIENMIGAEHLLFTPEWKNN